MEGTPIKFYPEKVALSGLTEIYVPDKPESDIVLIHSLGGDPRTTWTTANTTEKRYVYDNNGRQTGKEYIPVEIYWPYFNAPRKSRVLVFGYNSNVLSFVESQDGTPSFLGYARNLVNQLVLLRRKEPLRPLMFVGTGLGGYLVKKCLSLCRIGDDDALQQLACATSSVVFICCPQVDGSGTSLPEAVTRVLRADGVDNIQALVGDFRRNIGTIRQLHEDFLLFLEERAPMLKIWTIQEQSRSWVDGASVTEPTTLEDDVINLKHRYESFETAYARYNLIPKVQFHGDFSVREACWALPKATVPMRDRKFLPATALAPPSSNLHMQVIEEASQLLSMNDDASTWIGLVGPLGLGKTHVALEACHRISNRLSPTGKSIFWVNADNRLTLEADLERISSKIGLHSQSSGDICYVFMDFLKSRYSGDWVLVFDNVTDKSGFLDFPPASSFRHSCSNQSLVDMIPSKLRCNVLLLAREASCLEAILGSRNSRLLQLSTPTIKDSTRIVEEMGWRLQNAGISNVILDEKRRTLAELFGCNPSSLVQAVIQAHRKPEMLDALEERAYGVTSSEELVALPTRLAIEKIKEESPESLSLLGSLTVLESREIPSWLVAHLAAEDESQGLLDILHDYGLIVDLTRRDDDGTDSYVRVHPLALSVVKTVLGVAEWEKILRGTILTLCHAFMNLETRQENVIEIFKASKAVSIELDNILPMETWGVTGGGKMAPAAFLKPELDDFALHFGCSHYSDTAMVRGNVEKALNLVATGELSRMYEAFQLSRKGRGGVGDSGGSMGVWWYTGKELKAKKYTYE